LPTTTIVLINQGSCNIKVQAVLIQSLIEFIP